MIIISHEKGKCRHVSPISSACVCVFCVVVCSVNEEREKEKERKKKKLIMSVTCVFPFFLSLSRSLCVQNNLRCTGEEPRWRIYLTHRKLSLSGEKRREEKKESKEAKHLPPFIGPFVARIATAV